MTSRSHPVTSLAELRPCRQGSAGPAHGLKVSRVDFTTAVVQSYLLHTTAPPTLSLLLLLRPLAGREAIFGGLRDKKTICLIIDYSRTVIFIIKLFYCNLCLNLIGFVPIAYTQRFM